jgi:hypothetical protein
MQAQHGSGRVTISILSGDSFVEHAFKNLTLEARPVLAGIAQVFGMGSRKVFL